MVEARAQGAERRFSFDIPPGPVPQAVNEIGRTTGLAVVFSESKPIAARGRAVRGTMTAAQAVSVLLSGTGLTYRFSNATTVTIVDPSLPVEGTAAIPGEVALDMLEVEARNAATTEGTRSYAAPAVTVAGKVPMPVRAIPNSVSVIARRRIEDQNLNSADEALRQVTGVTAASYGDGTSYFNARGYPLDAQYDGLPIVAGIQYLPQFDMSIYDRIEVLRGPTGLLQGSGGPAGVANFVRRMPLDHAAVSTDTQIGSWNFYRQTVDASAPLNESGTARGRLIVTGQDRDFFYNEAGEWHGTAYGALQVDLTPQTTLSLSGAYQARRLASFDYGQSRYSTFSLLKVPRSAFFGADWSFNNDQLAEGYGNLRHQFDNGWVLNTSALYSTIDSDSRYAYMIGGVNPATGLVNYIRQSGLLNKSWLGTDANLSGTFDVLGRKSTFLIGANYSRIENHQYSGFKSAGLFNFLDAHRTIPDAYVPRTYGQDSGTDQGGVYGQTRLKLLDPLTLVLGGRLSWYGNALRNLIPSIGTWASDPSINGKFTPFAGLVYDLDRTYSVYASYTDIFTPQNNPTVDGHGLPPRVGSQVEVGAKASYFDDRLIATLAAFNIDDNHRAVTDPANPRYSISIGRARSRGIEAEITGNVLPGWDLSAGYTYLLTRYLTDPTAQGASVDPEEPKHTVKLWSSYTIPSGGLEGLSFGAGLCAVSHTARSIGNGYNITFFQGGYAVADAQIGYRFNEHVEGTLTVRNIFDRKYFDRIPTQYYGIYGEPRSIMVSLRSRW